MEYQVGVVVGARMLQIYGQSVRGECQKTLLLSLAYTSPRLLPFRMLCAP